MIETNLPTVQKPQSEHSAVVTVWRIGSNQPQAKEKGALRQRGGLTHTYVHTRGESQADETTVWGTPLKGDINRLDCWSGAKFPLLIFSQEGKEDVQHVSDIKGSCALKL